MPTKLRVGGDMFVQMSGISRPCEALSVGKRLSVLGSNTPSVGISHGIRARAILAQNTKTWTEAGDVDFEQRASMIDCGLTADDMFEARARTRAMRDQESAAEPVHPEPDIQTPRLM